MASPEEARRLQAELLQKKLRLQQQGRADVSLTDVAKGANRAITSLLQINPVPDELMPGGKRSPTVRKVMEEQIMGVPQGEQTSGQKFARRVGEEVGMNVLPGGALLKGAGFLSNVGKRALTEFLQSGAKRASVGQAARAGAGQLGAGVASTPGKAAAGELVATVGSGTGAAVAQQAAPGDNLAEMAGQLAGGLAPAAAMAGPTAMAARMGKKLGGRLLESTLGSVPDDALNALVNTIRRVPLVGDPAANVVAGAADKGARMAQESSRAAITKHAKKVIGPQEQANLASSVALEERVPGLNVPLGAATRSPDLLATHFNIQQYMTPQERMTLAMQLRQNERAVTNFAEANRPQSDLAPDYVINVAEGKLNAVREEGASESARITGQREGIASQLPRINKADEGSNLRQIQNDIYAQRMREMNELKDALGLKDVDISVPFNDWRNAMLDKYSDPIGDLKKIPDVEAALMRIGKPNVAERMADSGGGEPDPAVISWDNLETLDQELYDMWQSSRAGSNPDYGKARVIAEIRKDVQGFMDSLDGELGEAYRGFKNTYRENIIVPFREGAAFEVTEKNSRNFYRTYDEEVADTYFGAGAISSARKFKQVFGDNPEANRSLENIALDDLRSSAAPDGVIDPAKFEKWVARHETVLDEFSGLRQRIGSIRDANAALIERQAQLTQRMRQVEDDKLTRILGKVTKVDLTAEDAIGRIVKDSRVTARIWEMLDDQGKRALQQHVWDSEINKSAAELTEFISKNSASLSIMYGEDGLKNLKTLVEAKEAIELSGGVAGRAFQPNPLVEVERQLGMSIPVLASRMQTINTGRASKAWVVWDAFGRFIRGHSAIDLENAWKQAMFDKELASDLIGLTNTKAFDSPTAKRLKTRFFLLGQGGMEEEPPPEAPPPVDLPPTVRGDWLQPNQNLNQTGFTQALGVRG